jgi:hypothetical protein
MCLGIIVRSIINRIDLKEPGLGNNDVSRSIRERRTDRQALSAFSRLHGPFNFSIYFFFFATICHLIFGISFVVFFFYYSNNNSVYYNAYSILKY